MWTKPRNTRIRCVDLALRAFQEARRECERRRIRLRCSSSQGNRTSGCSTPPITYNQKGFLLKAIKHGVITGTLHSSSCPFFGNAGETCTPPTSSRGRFLDFRSCGNRIFPVRERETSHTHMQGGEGKDSNIFEIIYQDLVEGVCALDFLVRTEPFFGRSATVNGGMRR